MRGSLLSIVLVLAACGSEDASGGATGGATRAPELGVDGSATLVELFAGSELRRPRDLAFNPQRPDELWIVNDGDGSVVIFHGITGDAPTYERRRDAAADHFMHKPSSIAFGASATSFGSSGTFATCGESRNEHGIEGAHDFMGPVLWSSDLAIFAREDPIGLGSHLDMLHNSPLCMGIAHEGANVYWTLNGRDGSIIRNDFATDHGVGMDDHGDGASLEYVRGQLGFAPGVPSHLAFHAGSAMLYIADTAHGRVLRLDTTSGTRGARLPSMERQQGGHYRIDDAVLTEVVPPGALTAPSGLELRDDVLFVSDNATGRIVAFDLQGNQLEALDTGLGAGALAGMAFGPDGRLYFVDMVGGRLLRIER